MYNASVVAKEKITDSLFILKVKPDVEIPDFLPGQYIALGLPGSAPRAANCLEVEGADPEKLIKRSYSIGSPATEKGYYEFYIAVVPEGILSPRLVCLKEGDRLFIGRKPVGTFHLAEVPDGADLVFVSTGTGIAPYTAMLRMPDAFAKFSSITLIHGVRYETDFAYQDELKTLAQTEARFSYLTTVSRAGESWEGNRGYVQTFFDSGELALNTESQHIFLCGNPAMIEDLEVKLTECGFKVHSRRDPGNLHLEKYW